MNGPDGAVEGNRKYKIAARMLWMTFAITVGMLGISWATNDQQGETVQAAIEAVTSMWPWFVIALGGWFGVANVGEHVAAAINRGGSGSSYSSTTVTRTDEANSKEGKP